jgi:hypothetical protein
VSVQVKVTASPAAAVSVLALLEGCRASQSMLTARAVARMHSNFILLPALVVLVVRTLRVV